MNKYLKSVLLMIVLSATIIAGTTYVSGRNAAEFRAREAIAMERIHQADSTIAALRSEMSTLNDSVDSLTTSISLGTVEVEQARARARAAEASISLVTVEYTESDSVLVEMIVEAVEIEGTIVLLTDEMGVTTFGFSRSLAEDYLTKTTITLPALRNAVLQYRLAVNADSTLISDYAKQVGLQEQRYVILGHINSALTVRANEFEGLYDAAKRAYKKEQFIRQATVVAAAGVVLGILLLK